MRARIKETLVIVQEPPCNPVERRFSDELSRAVAAIERADEDRARASAEILTGLVSYFAELTPPKRLRVEHAKMHQAFERECVALIEYNEAVHRDDVARAGDAANIYQVAAGLCYTRLHELGVRTAGPLPRRAH
jgi:hypothetical protein